MIVQQKNSLDDIVGGEAFAFCKKACYTKKAKEFDPFASQRIPWNKDGKNGPDDPNNSENILIEWLTTEGNYNKYRGKGNNGTKKKEYAAMLARKMELAGCTVKRSALNVCHKIGHIEGQFRTANDWSKKETGVSIQEEDPGNFGEVLEKKCPHYSLLELIMVLVVIDVVFIRQLTMRIISTPVMMMMTKILVMMTMTITMEMEMVMVHTRRPMMPCLVTRHLQCKMIMQLPTLLLTSL